jgi:putative transposase
MKVRSDLEAEGTRISIRQLCEWLEVPRASVYRENRSRGRYRLNGDLVAAIRRIIDEKPYFGLRRIHWQLNRERKEKVNRKAVHRILKIKGWLMKKRPKGLRPRVRAWKSQTDQPNKRWAIDTSHFMTAQDGWCHITAVIDCCDRTIVGWRASRSGKAGIAAAALEDALIRRNPGSGLKLRSDNGLVFGSAGFQDVARRAGIYQEYITPYTPEQNGMIERWFLTLKSECLWLKNFGTLSEAREEIDQFVEKYNRERPHRALGMLSPSQWMEKFAA